MLFADGGGVSCGADVDVGLVVRRLARPHLQMLRTHMVIDVELAGTRSEQLVKAGGVEEAVPDN